MHSARGCTSSGTMVHRTHPRTNRDRTTILSLRLISICACVFLEPRPHAERVYANAKQVCGNKAKLRRSQCNCRDDQAVDNCDKESDPRFSCEQYCRQHGEETRKIVQMEHRALNLFLCPSTLGRTPDSSQASCRTPRKLLETSLRRDPPAALPPIPE
jgi:hypothetical protein